jgi:hypothetical protein
MSWCDFFFVMLSWLTLAWVAAVSVVKEYLTSRFLVCCQGISDKRILGLVNWTNVCRPQEMRVHILYWWLERIFTPSSYIPLLGKKLQVLLITVTRAGKIRKSLVHWQFYIVLTPVHTIKMNKEIFWEVGDLERGPLSLVRTIWGATWMKK